MTTAREAQGVFSPELRASIYHFMVFASTGVSSVYFAIWLSNRGITPDETGIITAVPVLAMLAINVFVGRIADKAKDWRSVIIILSLIAGAVPIGLFFVSGFWGILLLWTLCVVPAAALVPVIDAATLRMTQRRGTNFGVVRAWGTSRLQGTQKRITGPSRTNAPMISASHTRRCRIASAGGTSRTSGAAHTHLGTYMITVANHHRSAATEISSHRHTSPPA